MISPDHGENTGRYGETINPVISGMETSVLFPLTISLSLSLFLPLLIQSFTLFFPFQTLSSSLPPSLSLSFLSSTSSLPSYF